ncbi:MAG: hypothetical protein JW722_00105 [Demequinaceae bacterium]|nr:hypothetical protein [Demequinaceae bacterium]
MDPNPSAGVVTAPNDPCRPGEGVTAELGDPLRVSGRYATFTTDGSGIWVTARKYLEGGVLDPKEGRGEVWVGPASSLPTYDEQTGGVLGDVFAESRTYEGQWTFLALPPGDYWLMTGWGFDVVIQSCQPGGISNAIPDA